ncbi:MAG: LysR family transcriptional regulator [Lachnospiraceae bacterium]
MNLNQLQYFVTLAHLEHYTQASEKLSIAQPSLSHAMNMLEQELGTQLFEKQGRNVVLTKYGKLFLEYVENSLQILHSGVKKIKSLTGTTSGQIDLAYVYALGSDFSPQMVRRFLSKNPELDVQFQFTVGNTADIITGLKEERYDVAFCSFMEKETDILFTPIGKEELVVVVPANHDLAKRDCIDLEETIPYPQVYFASSSGLRPIIDNLYHSIGMVPHIRYEIEEDTSMAGLVAENFGIAVMPKIPILNNLNVKVLSIQHPKFERYIYMARMKNKYMTPIVYNFVTFIESQSIY